MVETTDILEGSKDALNMWAAVWSLTKIEKSQLHISYTTAINQRWIAYLKQFCQDDCARRDVRNMEQELITFKPILRILNERD